VRAGDFGIDLPDMVCLATDGATTFCRPGRRADEVKLVEKVIGARQTNRIVKLRFESLSRMNPGMKKKIRSCSSARSVKKGKGICLWMPVLCCRREKVRNAISKLDYRNTLNMVSFCIVCIPYPVIIM